MKGRLPHTKGREDPKNMYYGGTVFVDHASSLIPIYNQVTLGASDTIYSKKLYKLKTSEMRIKVARYRGDNGVYKSVAFQK